MEKDKKNAQVEPEREELDLEDLEKVTGAGLRDVYISETKDIDESIAERI